MTILNINFEADSEDEIKENLNYISYQLADYIYFGYNKPKYIVSIIDENGMFNEGMGIYNLSFEFEDNNDKNIEELPYLIKHLANMIDDGYTCGFNPYWKLELSNEVI